MENNFYRKGNPFDDFQNDGGEKRTGEGAKKKIFEGQRESQGGNYGQQNFSGQDIQGENYGQQNLSGQNSWAQGQAWPQYPNPQCQILPQNSDNIPQKYGDQMVSNGFLDFNIDLNNPNCNSHVQQRDLNMNLFGQPMANSQQPTPVTYPARNYGNFWDIMDGGQGGSNHRGNFGQTNPNANNNYGQTNAYVNNNYSTPFDAYNEQPVPQPTLDIFGEAEPKSDPFSNNVAQSNQSPAQYTGGDPFGNFNKHFDGGNDFNDFHGDPWGNQKENYVPAQNNNPGNVNMSNPFAGTNPFDSPSKPNNDFLSF